MSKLTSQQVEIFLEKLLTERLNLTQQLQIMEQMPLNIITAEIIVSAVNKIREYEKGVNRIPDNTIDLIGTGNDRQNTFNISTISSFLIAASGINIAKHGERGISSQLGCFDCLDALSIKLPNTPVEAEVQLKKNNICFLFNALYHPNYEKLSQARRELARKNKDTIFSILTPLLNPAKVKRIAIGVYQAELVPLMAEALVGLEYERALVFYGDGLDEFSLTGPTQYALVSKGKYQTSKTTPTRLGLKPCTVDQLQLNKVTEIIKVSKAILDNSLTGPMRDIVILNAAVGIQLVHADMSLRDAIIAAEHVLMMDKGIEKLQSLQRKKR